MLQSVTKLCCIKHAAKYIVNKENTTTIPIFLDGTELGGNIALKAAIEYDEYLNNKENGFPRYF